MPTLLFPPGGSRFYAQNTASRFGCQSPVFHTTPHIYLFNEWKPPVQVAHEVSREFRLFTNIKIWRTVRLNKALWSIQVVRIRIKNGYRSIKRSIVSCLTLWESHLRATNTLSVWYARGPDFLPFPPFFGGLVFLIVIVPGWHLWCACKYVSVCMCHVRASRRLLTATSSRETSWWCPTVVVVLPTWV